MTEQIKINSRCSKLCGRGCVTHATYLPLPASPADEEGCGDDEECGGGGDCDDEEQRQVEVAPGREQNATNIVL